MIQTKDWEKEFDDILYDHETEILGEPFFTPTSVRKIVDIILTQQKKEILEEILKTCFAKYPPNSQREALAQQQIKENIINLLSKE